MVNENSKLGLSQEEFDKLRIEVAERSSHIPEGDQFQIGEVVRILKELGGKPIAESRVRRIPFVWPKRDKQHGYDLYSCEDIRDLLLIFELNDNRKIPYAQVGGLLLAESRRKLSEWMKSPGSLGLSTPPAQVQRAHLFWRSHLLMVLLGWLFAGTIPAAAHLLIRKKQYHKRFTNQDEAWLKIHKSEFTEIDSILNTREGDLVVFTTNDREVLHKHIGWEEWKQFHAFNWYQVQASIPQSQIGYEMAIAVPPASSSESIRFIANGEEARLFVRLLDACFRSMSLEVEQIELEKRQERDREHFSTRLDTVVELIPHLSPHWQYSAVLVPNLLEPNRLTFTTTSNPYPYEVLDKQIALSQPPAGWAFQNNQPVAIYRTIGERDPRIAFQIEEKARAVVAIPTSINGKPNGVLYVGTRKQVEDSIFTESDIQFLRVVARIVGELIELERMRLYVGQEPLRKTILEPSLRIEPWRKLREDIAQVVEHELVPDEIAKESHDNLHLMAIRLSNYDILKTDFLENAVEITEWVAVQVRSMAYRYYLEKVGQPTLYDFAPDKFILLLKRISMKNEEERSLRDELSAYLNSMQLSFEQGRAPTPIRCELWSLPFRYSTLALRIDQIGAQSVIHEIVEKTERAFHVLPFVHKAHLYEQQGAWEKAREQYELAYAIDPENVYVWRHIAKMCTQLHDYKGAVLWWERVTKVEKYPSRYRRLAHNLVCLGDLEYATRVCEEAVQLDDKDAKCYAEWANVLYHRAQRAQAEGHADVAMTTYDEAANKYRKAVFFEASSRTRATYVLRIAEIRYAQERYRDALSACSQALTYEPDNPDVPYWTVKICQAMRSSGDSFI